MSLQTYVTKIEQTILPTKLIATYQSLMSAKKGRKNWLNISEDELWKELCFCILSANVPYELARSTTSTLWEKNFLDSNWVVNFPNSESILSHELSSPQFLPRKEDGSKRKYRYPNIRSKQICRAARIIYPWNSIRKMLSRFGNSESLRKYLYETIPGIGIKETSHFLRNIQYRSDLAIIDVHVLSFLVSMNLVTPEKEPLTLRRYLMLEQILFELSSYHELDLGIFDLAIWHYMRDA